MHSSPDHRPIGRDGWALFAAMGLIWGVPYLLIKVAVAYVSPPLVVFGRTAVAAGPLLFIAARRAELRPALAAWRWVLAFAVMEMAIPWILLTDAERHLPSGLTGLMLACVPMIGAVVAFFLGDRLSLRPVRLAGIALGLGGVAFLVAGDIASTAPWFSIAEVLVVCVGYATAPFVAVRKLSNVPDLGVVGLSLAFVATVYAVPAAMAWPASPPPGKVWAAIIGLGVVCTLVAFVVFFRLIATIGPTRATLITFVNPAVAVAVGAVLLDERISMTTMVAFVLIMCGCWLATRQPRLRHEG